MRIPEQFPELKNYILENSEFLFLGTGLEASPSQFITDYQRFQGVFTKTLDDCKIREKSLQIQPQEIIDELAKFSRTKVRHALLREYREFCASLRVLNVFLLYPKFFIAPFTDQELLKEKFYSKLNFHKLNRKLAECFADEDKRKDPLLPRCRGYYHCALMGIDFVEQRKTETTGILVGNFRELSHFFVDHPLIRDFFDENLEEITRYAIIFNGTENQSLIYRAPSKDISKLQSKEKLNGNVPLDRLSHSLFKKKMESIDQPVAESKKSVVDGVSLFEHPAPKNAKQLRPQVGSFSSAMSSEGMMSYDNF